MTSGSEMIRRLRDGVADELAYRVPPGSDEGERRAIGEIVIAEVVGDWLHAHGYVEPEEEARLKKDLFSMMFGMGRLQVLLDDPDVENIDANGCDVVWVRSADGSKRRGEAIADTDDELIELIRMAAVRLGIAERRFDLGHPMLDLRLPDGSRLSAVMSVSERPCLSIRRHRYADVTLERLVELEMLDDRLAAFLRAAVLARKNIIVSGAMNAGKTTLLRALAAEVPQRERIVTIEQSLELGLDKQSRHPDCVALEAREPNTEGEGEVSMADLVRRSLRMGADRVIVGEVLGSEIINMLNAMSQGRSGSMCTIHAESSEGVFRRIASYAVQSEERLPLEATNILIAGALHFVVHLDLRPVTDLDGRPLGSRRVVSSVREVAGADGHIVHSNELWAPAPDRRAVPHAPMSDTSRAELATWGYEADDVEAWSTW